MTGAYGRGMRIMTSRSDCVQLFHALSDPTRLRVLELLRDEGTTHASLIGKQLGMEQSRMSFHLQTLKGAGLVKTARDGRWVDYSLDGVGVEKAKRYLGRF